MSAATRYSRRRTRSSGPRRRSRPPQQKRDEADAKLDQALAKRGWNRFYGAFSAVMYTHLTGPGHVVPRADLLRALEVERRNAA